MLVYHNECNLTYFPDLFFFIGSIDSVVSRAIVFLVGRIEDAYLVQFLVLLCFVSFIPLDIKSQHGVLTMVGTV